MSHSRFHILMLLLMFATSLFAQPKEVLVVDKGVSNYHFFVDNANEHTGIILLERDLDGLQQIAAALKKYDNLDAVHIVSHGESGKLFLGASAIDQTVLDAYAVELKSIGSALSVNGDLSFYGCNVAAGDKGKTFVNTLAQMTGADVAASSNLTGASLEKADWALEMARGDVTALLPLPLHLLETYSGVLVTTGTVDGTYDFGSVGVDDSAGVGFKTQGDKFHISNGFLSAAPVIYAASTASFSGTLKAENGTTMKTFTVTDMNFGNFVSSSTILNFSITFKDYLGATIATHAFTGSSYVVGTSNAPISAFPFTVAFPGLGYSNIAQIDFSYTLAAATSNFELRDITLSNISAAIPPSNIAPTLGGTFTTTGSVNDNGTTTPLSGVTVSDADGDNVSVTITYTAANGTLSGTGLTGSAGNYTVSSAAPATATTNLQNITFTPTANQVTPGATVVTAFTLTPNDGTTNGASDGTTQITATSINDAPVITSNGAGATAATSINENTTAVTTVTKTDADTGQSYTFSISGGLDSAKFNINSSTGVLTFASAPDFETATDNGANNIYDVQVTVSDGSASDVQDIAVTVTNVNETPVITSNGGGAIASVNAAENQTAVTTVTATDGDAADTLTYSISGGADAAKFAINSSTGVLTFLAVPDFEIPGDSGANNVYDVQVTVSDSALTDLQDITVALINVNETPVITSNGGGATAATSINENATAVTTVTAIDVDAATTLTYSISGGADAAKFAINSSTGALTFLAAPDFEAAGDVGGNNVYDVQVTVSDSALTDIQDIAVTVTDLNEDPVITTGTSFTTVENTTSVGTVVTATDPEGLGITYSLSGADAALFALDSVSGVLNFNTAPDFEAPGSAATSNTYSLDVTASDSVLSATQSITVSVTDIYDVDSDSDTIYDNVDNCVNTFNTDQLDGDSDGIGDACDAFPLDPDNDIDGDTISGHIDNCPVDANLDQLDSDSDGMGDVCDAFPNNDASTTPTVTAPVGASTSINVDGDNEISATQPDGTTTTATTNPNDGTTGHFVIQPDGTTTSALFEAPGADIVIGDNGDVNSTVTVNGVTASVQTTSDGNTTHLLSLDINGTTVTTEASVGFAGATTVVGIDGSIETNATITDVNGTEVTYVMNAEINGSSSYTVMGADFNTTVSSSVPGASTYLGADGNITLVTPALNVNGEMVEAIVATTIQGESSTAFRVTKVDLSVIVIPTLNVINRFEPGNSVIVNDFDGFYEFIVQTPLNAALLF